MYDVCIITTIHGDFDNRIYHRQLLTLVENRLSVCIIAPWDFQKSREIGYTFFQTRMPKKRIQRFVHCFVTYKIVIQINAKIYIFHDPDFLIHSVLLKMIKKRKVIYDCHENIPEDILYGKDWLKGFLKKPLSRLFRKLENTIVKYLGNAIVPVPFLENRFIKLGVNTVMVRNYPNFQAPVNFIKERALLYTGSLSNDYGIDILINIARLLKERDIDLKMNIVDRFYFNTSLRNEIRDIIDKEDLNVDFLDPVLPEDMPNILSKGHIGLSPTLILPNKSLAYPTKIFEYFAHGLVVIATNTPSTAHIMKNGTLGILLSDKEYNKWVDAIILLLNNRDVYNKYQDKARNAYIKKYNWKQESKIMVKYINHLLYY